MPIEDFFEKVEEEAKLPEEEEEEAKVPEEPKAPEAPASKESKEEEEEGKGVEDSDKDEDIPAEGKGEEEEAEGASGALGTSEVQSLRVLLREQSQELAESRARSLKLEKKLTSSGIIEDGELDSTEKGVSPERRASLDLLAETMRMNLAYPDFDKVLDQSVFDETVLAIAKSVVSEEGGRLSDRIEEVSEYVWGLPNPYKYMYDIIKTSHPSFKKEEKKKEGAGEPKPSAPPSLQNLPGGSSSQNDGWTAAKIDKLDEEDLSTVPPKVYEKYMEGALA